MHEVGCVHFYSLVNRQPVKFDEESIAICSKAFQKSYKIDYIGLNIPNDFIVGYGLDYDSQGRNLKDIYKITDNN